MARPPHESSTPLMGQNPMREIDRWEVDPLWGRLTHSHDHGSQLPWSWGLTFIVIFSIASFKNNDFNNIFSKNQKVRNLTSIFSGKVEVWSLLREEMSSSNGEREIQICLMRGWFKFISTESDISIIVDIWKYKSKIKIS